MKWLSIALSAVLLAESGAPARGQTPAPLRIVVVEGEAGINNIRTGSARDVVVRVEDDGGKPVEGAAVVFSLPAQGAGGAFPDSAATLTVMTDAAGLATMRGLRPNRIAGKFQIHVNASQQGRTARADVAQFNMVVPNAAEEGGRSSKKMFVILALAGAAAAGGAAAALRGGSKTTPAPVPVVVPPIVVVTGGTVMGPPQ
jgi:hypothetical protein